MVKKRRRHTPVHSSELRWKRLLATKALVSALTTAHPRKSTTSHDADRLSIVD